MPAPSDVAMDATDTSSQSVPQASADVPARSDSGRRRRELFASTATLAAFAVVFAVFAIWVGGDFLDVSRRMFDISRNSPQLLISIGVTVCLAAHNFDLSVASMAALSAFLTIGLYTESGWPMGAAIAAALVVGALGGLVNGLLITRLGLSAFIATLGTGGAYGGLTVVYSEGRVIGPSAESGPLPGWFSGPGSIGDFQQKVPLIVGLALVAVLLGAGVVSFLQRYPVAGTRRYVLVGFAAAVLLGTWAGGIVQEMSWAIVVLGVVALLVWIYLTYTSPGRATYAMGGNPRAATFAGVNTDRIVMVCFLASGLSSALAGVLLAAIQGSAVPGFTDPLLLPAYSAVFLSTVLLSRGRFHVWGTVVGGIFLVYVSSGLIAGGVAFTWSHVINGVVLVATVSLSTILRRRH